VLGSHNLDRLDGVDDSIDNGVDDGIDDGVDDGIGVPGVVSLLSARGLDTYKRNPRLTAFPMR
jgi:hypothetical protein